jgi:5-formyltetrahydrofolate cyclo-ligase
VHFNHLASARGVSDSEQHLAILRGAKRELRNQRLTARRARPAPDRDAEDAAIRQAATAWLDERAEASRFTLAAYLPMAGEPGGPEFPEALAGHVGRLLLPVLRPDNDLDWAAFDGRVGAGRRGLGEPTGPRLGVDAVRDASVIVVPALAVDRRGARLGRGGGSYDRALARVASGALILAALYHGELLNHVPAEAHDRPVHGVIMDGRVIPLDGAM